MTQDYVKPADFAMQGLGFSFLSRTREATADSWVLPAVLPHAFAPDLRVMSKLWLTSHVAANAWGSSHDLSKLSLLLFWLTPISSSLPVGDDFEAAMYSMSCTVDEGNLQHRQRLKLGLLASRHLQLQVYPWHSCRRPFCMPQCQWCT